MQATPINTNRKIRGQLSMAHKLATLSTIIAICAVFATAPVTAQKKSEFPGTFSANVALTSEYLLRGLFQIEDAPAIHGGFDLAINYSDTDVSPDTDDKGEATLFTLGRSF